ncbi:c-type cytochrome [Desertivirga xinjiangensis]|uniref:c-type cytochrome n=1 Tax=Desertivirga xinjiangensis TaxID=539206 RepID=UPI00210C7628|nr:cytochrome C [Pedobacter xinjiangensis]
MKKVGKIIVYVFIAVVILVGGALSYVKVALPDVGDPPNIQVELTPARIERGKYLANHVTVCVDCHSTRHWNKFSGPLDTNGVGTGGEKFDHNIGFPGEVYVPNITPYNLGKWTDGEIYRAITSGVKKDGSAIFPIMPYKAYSKMDTEDIYSIIAYLRTLPPKETGSPERSLDFPVNFLVNTMPVKAQPQKIPAKEDQLAYGAYLVNSASCRDCHTKQEKGTPIEGMDFAGGYDFRLPGGTVSSANITQDLETGIGRWSKEQFISRFKSYQNPHAMKSVSEGDFQTVMPWTMYGNMETSDLEAIFTYLKTVKPIRNQVTKFSPSIASN